VFNKKSISFELFHEARDLLNSSVSSCIGIKVLLSEKYLTLAEFYAVDASFHPFGATRKKRLIFKPVCDIQVFIKKKTGDQNGQRDKGIFGQNISGPNR
jgi:hypothetical protein